MTDDYADFKEFVQLLQRRKAQEFHERRKICEQSNTAPPRSYACMH